MEAISINIPDTFDEAVHSTHRRCYQRWSDAYFMIRKRFADSAKYFDVDEPQPSTSKIRRSSLQAASKGSIFPYDKLSFVIRSESKLNKHVTL